MHNIRKRELIFVRHKMGKEDLENVTLVRHIICKRVREKYNHVKMDSRTWYRRYSKNTKCTKIYAVEKILKSREHQPPEGSWHRENENNKEDI